MCPLWCDMRTQTRVELEIILCLILISLSLSLSLSQWPSLLLFFLFQIQITHDIPLCVACFRFSSGSFPSALCPSNTLLLSHPHPLQLWPFLASEKRGRRRKCLLGPFHLILTIVSPCSLPPNRCQSVCVK